MAVTPDGVRITVQAVGYEPCVAALTVAHEAVMDLQMLRPFSSRVRRIGQTAGWEWRWQRARRVAWPRAAWRATRTTARIVVAWR